MVIRIVALTFIFFSSLRKANIKVIPTNKDNKIDIKKLFLLTSVELISIAKGNNIAKHKETINIPRKNKIILKFII